MIEETDKIKKIAVIVPSEESCQLYHSFFSNYSGFEFHDYASFEAFNLDTINTGGCDGYIIDLRIILKSGPEEKKFFQYIAELFPSIRISHSQDMATVSGDIKGRSFKNRQLFDFFFLKQFEWAETEKMNILLFVNDAETQNLYEFHIHTYPNVEIFQYQNFQQLMASISKKSRFSGIIVDLRTMMKASPQERESLHELMEVFPAMRISHSMDKQKVKGNIKDKNVEDKALFDYFFNDLCCNFTPKGIRCSKRYTLFLNIWLDISQHPDVHNPLISPEGLLKVNTENVSEDGLFINTTIPVQENGTISLIFNELIDRSPIQCVVKWILPWGESINHLPGFGAEFTAIKPNQKEELATLIKRKK